MCAAAAGSVMLIVEIKVLVRIPASGVVVGQLLIVEVRVTVLPKPGRVSLDRIVDIKVTTFALGVSVTVVVLN